MIAMSMGGLAAELLLGVHKLGGISDVAKATSLATSRVLAGVDPGARPVSYRHFDSSPAANDEAYEAIAATVATQRERAERIVAAHRPAIESLARALADSGHLSGADLHAAMVAAGLEEPTSAELAA